MLALTVVSVINSSFSHVWTVPYAAQVAVALLGDAARALLAAGAELAWGDPDPSGKIAPALEPAVPRKMAGQSEPALRQLLERGVFTNWINS
jgi:hypothetical protein